LTILKNLLIKIDNFFLVKPILLNKFSQITMSKPVASCARCTSRTTRWDYHSSRAFCHTNNSPHLTCYQKNKLEKEGLKCLFCSSIFNSLFSSDGPLHDEMLESEIKFDFKTRMYVCCTCVSKIEETSTVCALCNSESYIGDSNKFVKMPSGKEQRLCETCQKKLEKHKNLFVIDFDSIFNDIDEYE
jgi:hypothetical protein